MWRRQLALIVLGCLLALPVGLNGSGGPHVGVHFPVAAAAHPTPFLAADSSLGAPGALMNQSISPSLLRSMAAPGAGVPNSARSETPPPKLPPTTPVVLHFLNASRNCCYSGNFTPPTGVWQTIVLNYTGTAVNGVYDSSYRAYIDGSEVLFGTTPEYGTWTVLQNLSEYTTLFLGTTNLTFLLGAAVTNGYFLTNVSLSFYPVPAGGQPSPHPSMVIPLWYRQSATSPGRMVFTNATVPANASAAVLRLYFYGFGGDEFWWSTAQPFRALEFGVNNMTLGAVLPFPYVNTGGIDLFLWRPITAALTTDDRPYDLNLTGALGMLEGPQKYFADIQGMGPSSNWIVGGSLLVWTNASYRSAAPVASVFVPPVVTQSGQTQSARLSFQDSSSFATDQGTRNVTSSAYASFCATLSTTNGWENVSELTTLDAQTVTTMATGNLSESRSYSFPISVDLGSKAVPASGSYPYNANFTTYMLNTYQEWNEVRTLMAAGPGGSSVLFRAVVDDQLAGASGVFGGTEQVTGPNAALITSITFIQSSTTKLYLESVVLPTGTSYYSHLLVGSSYQPALPFEFEVVTSDAVRASPLPLQLQLVAPRSALDWGDTWSAQAIVAGGTGPYTYAWSGLPLGCPIPNASQLSCVPHQTGFFLVGVQVTDGAGDSTPLTRTALLVATALSAVVVAANQSVDLGQSDTFRAAVVGGFPPYSCTWYVGGAAQGLAGNCSAPFPYRPTVAGPLNVSLWVVDGDRRSTWGGNLTMVVGVTLSVALFSSASTSTIVAGNRTVLSAVVLGGSAPWTVEWFLNGTLVPGVQGTNFTFLSVNPGTYRFKAMVTDLAQGHNFSNELDLTVVAAPPPSAPSESPANNLGAAFYVALGAGVVGLIAIVGILLSRSRTRPPPTYRRGPPKAPPEAES